MPRRLTVRAFHDKAEEAVQISDVFAGLAEAFHAKDAAKFDSHFTDDAGFVTTPSSTPHFLSRDTAVVHTRQT